MSNPLYIIRNWNEHYEIAQSRRNKKAHSWVAIPNKHDGKSFRRLMAMPDGMEIYGAWCLLIQIASKCPTRGVLADDDGPLTAEDLSLKTGGKAKSFAKALEVLASKEVRWIVVEHGPVTDTELRERSERSMSALVPTLPDLTIPDSTEPEPADAGFDQFWEVFPSRRKTSRAKAREAWAKAIKKARPDEIIAAATEYAASESGRGEFAKMPSSWLNGECWLDDRQAWSETVPAASRLPTAEDLATWTPFGGND